MKKGMFVSPLSLSPHLLISLQGKKRFEIACYKNKVLEWRSGIEKQLDNVLQVPQVFINVSKGQFAPKADLTKAFPGKKTDDIIRDILDNGELQVGEKERQAQLDRVHNEVIDIVASKLVDPKTKRVYTSGMIEKALDQLSQQSAHQQSEKAEKAEKTEGAAAENAEDKGKEKQLPRWSGVVQNKSAKSQALFAMKALIAHQPIPVMRARMRLRVNCPTNLLKHSVKSAPKASSSSKADDGEEKATGTVKDTITGLIEEVESQDVTGDEWEIVGFVEPGAFKTLSDFIGSQTKGRGRVEVLDTAIVHEDD
jgi:ribosome maturation protein SDO1